MASTSPEIEALEWGAVIVESGDGSQRYRDAKLWPGGSRGWDWGETGTHHEPGVQPADVRELVENGAKIVVLSKGQQERLKVQQKTLDWLADRDVEVEVLESRQAVERYNELAASEQVGALIHSTC